MKKIVIITGNLEESGGTQKMGISLANELIKKNYSITIVGMIGRKESFFEIDERIQVLALNPKLADIGSLDIFKLSLSIYQLLKKDTFDTVIEVDPILKLFTFLPLLFFREIRVISWEHFNFEKSVSYFKGKLSRFLAFKFSDYVITLTKNDEMQYKKKFSGKAKIETIPNFTSEKLNRSNYKNKQVLAIGNYWEVKGFDRLLEIWKKVEKKDEWKLTIVGLKNLEDYKEKFKDLIDENIQVIGPQKNIKNYYTRSSIFVLTSRYEGFPMVAIEAKSYGLPIVSFRCCPGIEEIIENKSDGYLIKNGDIDTFSSTLEMLIVEEKLRKKISDKVIKDTRFMGDRIQEKWMKLL